MKKILALIVAMTLASAMSITAFATVETNGDTKQTKVTFNVEPTYMVTIPALVTLQKVEAVNQITYENNYVITASAGVRLKKNEYIEVTVTSDYEMETQEGATLAYTITKDDAPLVDSVVAIFNTDKAEQTSQIHIAANDPDYAGEYEDKVTFTVAVKTASSSN